MFEKKISALLGAMLIVLAHVSCSGKLGWSIVLWSDEKYQIPDGTVVPVYNRSNIYNMYAIGNPATGERIEVPLWQITEPLSKSALKALAAQYAEYAHTYASVKIDGLPVRAKADNTAKSVYRLRKDEVVRVLYKGEGAPVMSGKNALEGDWLYVLTGDGTSGWCFSYSLSLFRKDSGIPEEGISLPDTEAKSLDILPQDILSARWYPEHFVDDIKAGVIDTAALNPDYGFFAGSDSAPVRLHTEEYDISWDYKGVTKSGGTWRYRDAPLVLTKRGDDILTVQYTDGSGKPRNIMFKALDADTSISALIEKEYARRAQSYEQLCMFGPVFASSNYGTLTLHESGSFEWKNFSMLVPALLEKTARNRGTAEIKYILGKSLAMSWDGVLTMSFDGMEKEVNFLYKMESDGLRLEDAGRASFEGNTLIKQSSSSLVLFFAQK